MEFPACLIAIRRIARRLLAFEAAFVVPQIADQIFQILIAQNISVRRHAVAAILDLFRNVFVGGGFAGAHNAAALEEVLQRNRARPGFDRVLIMADPAFVIINLFSPQRAALGRRLEVIDFSGALQGKDGQITWIWLDNLRLSVPSLAGGGPSKLWREVAAP